jgi:hypothetical protein
MMTMHTMMTSIYGIMPANAIRLRERRFWIGWPFLELPRGFLGPLGLNLPERFPPPVDHFYEEMCFRTSRELATFRLKIEGFGSWARIAHGG